MGLSKKLLVNEISHISIGPYLKNKSGGATFNPSPIFIVGCGHSGTTMLRHVMGMHGNIYAVPYESRIFFHSDFKIRLADRIWTFTSIAKGKTRWLEKTPSHIHRLERILQMYPLSRIILMVRDGRDVSVSLYRRWGDYQRSVKRWINDNESGEPFWGHPQVLKIQYEELVSNFEAQMESICQFINEPIDEKILAFSKNTNIPEIDDTTNFPGGTKPREIRNIQIGRGLYQAKDKWKSQMTESQKQIFKGMAGEMLIRYGYANDINW